MALLAFRCRSPWLQCGCFRVFCYWGQNEKCYQVNCQIFEDFTIPFSPAKAFCVQTTVYGVEFLSYGFGVPYKGYILENC